jgi:hypothetical protein
MEFELRRFYSGNTTHISAKGWELEMKRVFVKVALNDMLLQQCRDQPL